jgi:LysM repeat protein
MKPTLLLTLLPLVLSTPRLLAKSDLEVLRARCAEQERQIRELEDENAKLRSLHNLSVNSTRPKALPGGASAAAPAAPAGGATATYVVKRGDSWERIAGKFGTKPAALASLNGMKESTMIHAGQKLKVPGTPAAEAAPTAAPQSRPAPAPSLAGKTHLVKQGETFYSIAKKYGVSSASLEAANPAIKPAAMRPGQVVHLSKPPATQPATVAAVAAPPKPAAVTSTAPTPAPAPKPAPAQAPPSGALAAASHASLPVSTQQVPAASAKPAGTAAASSPAPAKTRVKSVLIDGKTTFGEFAAQHGTDVAHLNELNALDLVETTVLAKGSELYVPAQP